MLSLTVWNLTLMPDRSTSWTLFLSLLALAIFLLRITGTADLEDNSQSRNVGYAMDLVHHGNWLIQSDLEGNIMSKPPLHTWGMGLFAVPFGLNRVTMALPSFLAILGLTLLVFHMARQMAGDTVGGLAAVSLLITPMLWRQIGMIRSDALFALFITGGAWAAFGVWDARKGWLMFWICGALAMLTKGPLGLLLSSAGLLAWFWEARTSSPARPIRMHGFFIGMLVFFAICLAWVIPALQYHREELIQKMIRQELIGHVTSTEGGNVEQHVFQRIIKPSVNFLTYFAPFCIFAVLGMWRAIRHPSESGSMRRFERFLTCWLLTGLLIFSLSTHHRSDHLLPLWPAGAILSGREIYRLCRRFSMGTCRTAIAVLSLIALVVVFGKYHAIQGKVPKSARDSESIRQAAIALRRTHIHPADIHFLNSPDTFQYYLKNPHARESTESIVAASDANYGPFYIATDGETDDPLLHLKKNEPHGAIHEVFRWPQDATEKPIVKLFQMHRRNVGGW